MAFQVFISYSTRDLPLVQKVREAIDGTGVSVFIAEHSIKAGESLSSKILGALKQCDLFVLLWSRHSRGSEWVLQEIGAARAANRPIVPVVLESGLQLPALLGDLKYLSVHDNPEAALAWLRENVLSRVAQKRQGEIIVWVALGILAVLALRSE